MKNMKMKKAVGVLMAAMLSVSAAVPVLATNSTYGTTNYYDIDFENYATSGKTAAEFMTVDGYTTPQFASGFAEVDDAVMGKAVKIAKGATETYGARVNFNGRYTKNFVEGDKFFIELSMKVDGYGENTFMLFGGLGSGLGSRLFELESATSIKFARASKTVKKTYNVGEWMHLVFEFAPGASNGTVITYMNGEKISEDTSTSCILDYFNSTTWSSNRLEVNGAEISVSKMRSWTSKESYDSVKAGDSVSVTSTNSKIKVLGDDIAYKSDVTVAELKSMLSATGAVALKADGTVAADTDMISIVKNVAVKSASGDAVKYFTVKEYNNVYFDVNMADYTDGSVETFINGKLNGKAKVGLNGGAVTAVEDTVKGHKVAKFASGSNWSGIDLNTLFTKGVTADEMVCMEMTVQQPLDYTGSGASLKYLAIDGGSGAVFMSEFGSDKDDDTIKCVRFGGNGRQNISADTWYTLKFEMIPATNTIKCYMDGKLVYTITDTRCNLDFFNGTKTLRYNRLDVPKEQTLLLDTFKAWVEDVPAEPVDPTEPSFAIYDNSIVSADVSMLAEAEKPVLYVAAYDKDGRVLEVMSDSTLGENGDLQVTFGEKTEYKVFLWDSEDLAPYIASATYVKGDNGVWTAK